MSGALAKKKKGTIGSGYSPRKKSVFDRGRDIPLQKETTSDRTAFLSNIGNGMNEDAA